MKQRTHPNDDPRPAKGTRNGITEKYRTTHSAGVRGNAEWAECSGEALVGLVSCVANQGGAILLGYSRDRGAYRVIIMDEDDKVTEWIPCTVDITEAVWALTASLQ